MSNDNKYVIYINGTAVEVSKEIHDFLVKSDRQMKYAEQDRKQERITIDSENERVSVKPSMEDSLGRLMELGVEFPDRREDMYESVIRKVMLEQAMSKAHIRLPARPCDDLPEIRRASAELKRNAGAASGYGQGTSEKQNRTSSAVRYDAH